MCESSHILLDVLVGYLQPACYAAVARVDRHAHAIVRAIVLAQHESWNAFFAFHRVCHAPWYRQTLYVDKSQSYLLCDSCAAEHVVKNWAATVLLGLDPLSKQFDPRAKRLQRQIAYAVPARQDVHGRFKQAKVYWRRDILRARQEMLRARGSTGSPQLQHVPAASTNSHA